MSDLPASDLTSFQGLIQTLQNYWSEQGCLIMQPLDMEVGAGTFHPATFIRAIGPEPWRAAYVQPSRRPTDGRHRVAGAASAYRSGTRGGAGRDLNGSTQFS